MSTPAIIIAIVVAVVVVAAAIVLIIRNQRSKRLRTRFGPEYSRVIGETGSKTQAEEKLKTRKKNRAF